MIRLQCWLGVDILLLCVVSDSCVGAGVECEVWIFFIVRQSCVEFVLWLRVFTYLFQFSVCCLFMSEVMRSFSCCICCSCGCVGALFCFSVFLFFMRFAISGVKFGL